MPKITRAQFEDMFDHLWANAQRNIKESKFLAQTLIGIDQMGRQTMFYGMDPDLFADEENRRRVTTSGTIPLPMPWYERVDFIHKVFREQKVVAGALIGEAWAVTGDRAMETIELGSSATDNPLHDEVIFVLAVWPGEHLVIQAVAEIVRGEDGAISLRPWGDRTDLAPEKDPRGVLASWLIDVLPRQ